MKEIGKEFKDKREEISISLDEVSDDLKIDKILIENLEEGNDKAFDDVIELKDVVLKYAKYLGMDVKDILDSVDDYLFEKTQKISIMDIKEGLSKTKVLEKKIKSPYTLFKNKANKRHLVIVSGIIIIIILIIFYIILRKYFIG